MDSYLLTYTNLQVFISILWIPWKILPQDPKDYIKMNARIYLDPDLPLGSRPQDIIAQPMYGSPSDPAHLTTQYHTRHSNASWMDISTCPRLVREHRRHYNKW